MRKEIIGLMFMLIIIASACGVDETSVGTTNEDKEKEIEQIDYTQVPAELNVFSRSAETEESFNARFGDAIRKALPNYTINYIRSQEGSTIEELLVAGTIIDIYYDSIGNFADGLLANKMEYDMTSLIESKNIDLSQYEPSVVEAIRDISDGKIYGLPVYTNNLVLFYNKAIFDQFGVEYPTDGMTWDEAHEKALKLNRKADEVQYLGLAVSPTHMLRMNQLSLPYVDPETGTATINNNEKWRQLFETTMIIPAQDPGYKEVMANNSNRLPSRLALHKDQYLAMYVFLSQLPFTVPELSEMDWDMVSLPTFKELPGIGSQSYPSFFSVTNMSESKEAAMEVVNYLVSKEFQLASSRTGLMPVLLDEEVQKAFGEDTGYTDKNFGAVFYNKFAPIAPKTVYDGQVESAYLKDYGLTIIGDIDINTAFRTAEDEANNVIAEMKKMNE